MKTKIFLILTLLLLYYPTFGQKSSTKKVAILNTVDKENALSYGMKLMVRGKLAYAITNTSGYEGYDRVDIASIMSEHEFQRTGLVNDAQIKRLGEMTGADYILIAEVAKLDDSHIFIVSKILNVETAKVENISSIQTATNIENMEKACRELAARLLGIQRGTDFDEAITDEPLREYKEKVFDVVEIMPSFPGGESELMAFLNENLRYPPEANENGIQGRPIITFVVERDGSITNVRVIRSVDPLLDGEAVRVVKMMPKWNPGKQNSTPVRVKFTLPINFRLKS